MANNKSPGCAGSAERGQYLTDTCNIASGADRGQTLAEAAVEYAALGWPVLPCSPRGKVPALSNGFNGASADLAQVAEWWRQWPAANVALVPGRCTLPGRESLIVIDVDGAQGRQSAVELDIPTDTATVATGRAEGGEHRYFRAPAGLAIGNRVLAPGLDIRHTAGYVLAPPSVHPSGASYHWLGAPAFAPGAVLDLPADILEALTAERLRPEPQGDRWGPAFTAGPDADARTWRRAAGYVARVQSGLSDGRRTVAYRLSAALLHDIALPERDAYDLLEAWNSDNCPPLEAGVLATVFQNAQRYGRHRSAA